MKNSGVLLHLTALPSAYGIGDMGPNAFKFVDLLKDAKQSVWQVLPICLADKVGCPYSSPSAFGGNYLLISPDLLVADGLLRHEELKMEFDDFFDSQETNFYRVEYYKIKLFHLAFIRFQNQVELHRDYEVFCQMNAAWLNDLSMFLVLTRELGPDWTKWPKGYRTRQDGPMNDFAQKMKDKIDYQKFLQFIFFRQWGSLRSYANKNGIQILGDIPIFINHHSMDVWRAPENYKLNSTGRMQVETGAAPDQFNALGQKWSTPNYNWHQMEKDDFKWWRERMTFNLQLFDIVRLDHFRGFVATWEIPETEELAANGHWSASPGIKLFDSFKRHLGALPIVIEDLGKITDDVKWLRDQLGYPGMRIMQFGFNEGAANIHLPHHYPQNCVAYTGTHDNDTVMGWFNSLGETLEKSYVYQYCQVNTSAFLFWDFIRMLHYSQAQTAIVPIQDILGLGSESRFNRPGKADGNWAWRVRFEDIKEDHWKIFTEITEQSGRSKL